MIIIDVLAFVFLFLTGACMVASIVCILLEKNDTCIPTLVSLGGAFAYLLFLACAAQHMNFIILVKYFALLMAPAVVAALTYYNFKRTEREEEAEAEFVASMRKAKTVA